MKGDEKGDLESELSVKLTIITNLVAGEISRDTRRNHALTPLHQVLIAPRFSASRSFLQVIGDTNLGVDKSTVPKVITDLSRALIAKQPRFIKWPSTNDECSTIKNAEVFLVQSGALTKPTSGYKRPNNTRITMSTGKVFIPSMCKVCNHGVKASIVQRIANVTSFKIKLISPSDKFLTPRKVFVVCSVIFIKA